MSKIYPLVLLGKILIPVSRPEIVEPQLKYNLLGTHWYAEGLYTKEIKSGSQIQAKFLYKVEKGDFVYNRLFAWKGSFAIATEENHACYVSNEFPCFTLNSNKIDSQYLWRYFSRTSAWDEALSLSSGGTPTSRNRLKEEKLLSLEIPLPPLEEQRRIMMRVEELVGKVEEVRSLRQKALEEAEALRVSSAKAIFHGLAQASTQPLRELVTVQGGGTPSKQNPFFWDGLIPWISPKDMKSREINNSIDHISEEATLKSSAKLLEPGSVLIVVRGMILAHTVPSAILRISAAINQDMKALFPNEKITPEFLCCVFWTLNDSLLELVEKSTHDTRKLETPKLLNFKIPVPPLPEQRRIVAYLDELQTKVDTMKRLREQAMKELDALMPSILDKAFKGKL
ncbi:MAG: restriction endonuclease subunit S [Nostoc sp.]|uniref:restriction endonuclease subunit S n=1 Tax=Nostoc sp. TaxID=1180 RepID=UPI002FFA1EA5